MLAAWGRESGGWCSAGLVTVLAAAAVVHLGRAAQSESAAASSEVGSYRFLQHQRGAPGTPVTCDPCTTIWVTINADGVPDPRRARDVVLEAMRVVSAISGLRLRYAGPSTDRPHWAAATQSPRVQARPVLVAFATSDEVPRLKGRVAGIGGSTSVRRHGLSTYVTGQVTLDARTFSKWLTEPAFLDAARATMLHELGHLVGLAHVHDDHELMNAQVTGLTDFGPGDRTGLALLGQGTCA